MRSMQVPRWLGAAVAWAWLSVILCPPPFDDVLVDEAGDQIRLVQIERIVNNDDLTEEEQREALEDLGITDDDLIDFLIDEL